METIYKFRIDLRGFDDDWVDIDVELSYDEVAELLIKRKTWFESDEFKEMHGRTIDDEEYFLHKYVPHIHKKVRKAIEEQLPSILGEEIMPQVDIYVPENLDYMELEEWESIRSQKQS